MHSRLHNSAPKTLTRSVSQIILGNIFTLFNILNIVLAVFIVAVGHWANTIFLLVVVCNTVIGIVQELRAKRTIDNLSIIARTRVTVIRDGNAVEVDQEELVLDDILRLKAGDQVCVDGEIVYSEGLEADESLLTGESDTIQKAAGSKVMSGSFITAGNGCMRVLAVGSNGYAAKLALEAKQEKKQKSELINTLNNIIRILTVVIIPVGGILFYAQFEKHVGLSAAVLGTSAAMLGMIPEGLIFLTSITLAVGAMNLARRKTLVQSLPCIETLARADVLCLDKTGTITDGSLKVVDLLPVNGYPGEQAPQAIAELMNALRDENPTAEALRTAFPEKPTWPCTHAVHFSSRRKWSGASFGEKGSYLLGAPEFLSPHLDPSLAKRIAFHTKQGFRVICLAYAKTPMETDTVPADTRLCALIILSDTIRKDASQTFRYFAEQGVTIKVISGDNAATVSNIAARAGLKHAERYIDMSRIADETDLCGIVEENTVFGRVSPYQKRKLIQALQKNGHTACMTGDGVNDVLALKEADCGVAMSGGADAARSAADFVLLQSNFSAMVEVLKEGRRVINNIEQVASLYLVKTIYSTILSILFTFLPFVFPFAPLQLTPVNLLAVGIPSLVLALLPNYKRPHGKFAANILENSFPAAIIVVCNILIIQLAGIWFGLRHAEISTMNVFLIGVVGFVLLFEIVKPLTYKKVLMLIGLAVAFLAFFLMLGQYFMLSSLLTRNVFFYLPLALASRPVFRILKTGVLNAQRLYQRIAVKFLSRAHSH